MMLLLVVFSVGLLGGCAFSSQPTPTLHPTATPHPTSTPYPTATPEIAAGPAAPEVFLETVQKLVDTNDALSSAGQDAILAVIGNEPTYAFIDNPGIVLQFNVMEMPDNEPEVKQTALLLMSVGLVAATEHQIPLWGIEVVYYTHDKDPWLALALAPPWDMQNDLRVAPIHPEYIKRLLDAGMITPTPAATATAEPGA